MKINGVEIEREMEKELTNYTIIQCTFKSVKKHLCIQLN